MTVDPNSAANIKDFQLLRFHFNWTIDFATKTIRGYVEQHFIKKTDCTRLVLDARNLKIDSVQVLSKPCNYKIEAAPFGEKLVIELNNVLDEFNLRIYYETTKGCKALQWLEPHQTAGQQQPFMFSQCQAINARSLFPCMDTPAVKAPYSADVSVVGQDGLTVLMSANKRTKQGSFHFEQTMPVPAYLVAIACGTIVSRKIGARSTLWCEQELLERASFEFSQTDDFIKTAEDIVGPYRWEIYDFLVLPASFPYGGMENPCLTFLTPSLIAGDRSLVSTLAHEISHSWTGNLVSCSSWEHFWLNEGFTRFLERKIIGRLSGEPVAQLGAHLGLGHLQMSIAQLSDSGMVHATALVPDLKETDPDDAFSGVPYEKGYAFLFYLEHLLGGRAVFEPYLRAHIEHFAEKSIDTVEWRQFLFEYFHEQEEVLKEVDWNGWLYGFGMMPSIPAYDRSLLIPCESFFQTLIENELFDEALFTKLSPIQQMILLDMLAQRAKGGNLISRNCLAEIDARCDLSHSGNVEIGLHWFLLCIRAGYEPAYQAAINYANSHGRMKYCRPIYREMYLRDSSLARQSFLAHGSFFHPIAHEMISKDLGMQ